MKVKVGNIVKRIPVTFYQTDDQGRKIASRPTKARVVYVHPLGRYHVVAFDNPSGGDGIREAFHGVEKDMMEAML